MVAVTAIDSRDDMDAGGQVCSSINRPIGNDRLRATQVASAILELHRAASISRTNCGSKGYRIGLIGRILRRGYLNSGISRIDG